MAEEKKTSGFIQAQPLLVTLNMVKGAISQGAWADSRKVETAFKDEQQDSGDFSPTACRETEFCQQSEQAGSGSP